MRYMGIIITISTKYTAYGCVSIYPGAEINC